MKIKNQKMRNYLRNAAYNLFNHLENNNTCSFETNGEKSFLIDLLQTLKKKECCKISFV